MADAPTGEAKQAGLVLALLGAVTYGATSPFGLVLCGEWLLDPRRTPRRRFGDTVGLLLSLPGTLVIAWLSISLFDADPGGHSFRPYVLGYWLGLGGWVWMRSRYRWVDISRARNAACH